MLTAAPHSSRDVPGRRAELVVDLDAIRSNVHALTSIAAPSGALVMPIVKANAYGHGLVHVAKTAVDAGVSWLGTCDLASAFTLREAGVSVRLFSWLETPDADYGRAIAEEIDVSVSSSAELRRVATAATAARIPARVHLEVDTGLWRSGCPPQQWQELVLAAASEPFIEVVAVWSHLACADDPTNPFTDEQARRFDDAYRIAVAAGLAPLRHLANSAATLSRPDLHFDIVRPGLAVYGHRPLETDVPLQPAMSFLSTVVLTKRITAGESVSYGHTWTAEHPTNLALVPVGYGDGVPRSLSGRTSVAIGGVPRPVVGLICMDQLIVDCGDDLPEIGDPVVLFEPDGAAPTVEQLAADAGTINYEILTSITGPRISRRYIN